VVVRWASRSRCRRRSRFVTREQLEARLVMAYGGRAAEEIVFGRDRVTTGAASDIQQATNIARRYVTQWGLSDTIGPILVGDNEQELFLGREIQSRREVSEQTAQLVDAEVKRVVMEAHRASVVGADGESSAPRHRRDAVAGA
jgi:cell division protease FtsH